MISKYYATFDVKLTRTDTNGDFNGKTSNLVSYTGIYIEITTDSVGKITNMRELHLNRGIEYGDLTNPINYTGTGSDTIQDYVNKQYTTYKNISISGIDASIILDTATNKYKYISNNTNSNLFNVGVLSLAHRVNGSKLFTDNTNACIVAFETNKDMAINSNNSALAYTVSVPSSTISYAYTLSFISGIISPRVPALNKCNLLINDVIANDSISPVIAPSPYNNITGWYYKNSSGQTAGNGVSNPTQTPTKKINWYIVPPTNTTVSNLKGLYLTLFNGMNVTDDNAPFITIYTAADSGTNPGGWYKSKRTFLFSSDPIQQTHYTLFINKLKSTNTETYIENVIGNLMPPVSSSVSGSSVGSFADTETIFTIAIGTSSSATVGAVEFIARSFGIITNNTNVNEYVFKSNEPTYVVPTGASSTLNLYHTNNLNRLQIVSDAKQLRNTNNIIDCFELKTVDSLSLTTSGIYSGNLYTNRADNTIVNVGTELNTLKIHIAYLEGIITTLLNQAVPTNGNNALPPL